MVNPRETIWGLKELGKIHIAICKEIAYAVQGQLHSLLERRKKFLILTSREVCEKAWYSIHGVSRAAYHKYKAAAFAGRVNGMHGNIGSTRPRPHTI